MSFHDLLMQFGQGFASNTLTALEVCLVLREVDGPSCQRALLQHPTSLVQRPLDDIFTEVIDSLADEEGLFVVSLNSDILTLRPRVKEAIALIARSACSEYTIRSTKDCLHVLRLVVKVSVFTLDDAERIYPQIADANFPRAVDSVMKGCWKIVFRNGLKIVL